MRLHRVHQFIVLSYVFHRNNFMGMLYVQRFVRHNYDGTLYLAQRACDAGEVWPSWCGFYADIC